MAGTSFGPFTFTVMTSLSFTVDVIGLLAPGTHSIANDLNDSGEVVGGAESAGGVGHAFMWTKAAGRTDLGSFGSTLAASALSVNNARRHRRSNYAQQRRSGLHGRPFVIGGSGSQQPGVRLRAAMRSWFTASPALASWWSKANFSSWVLEMPFGALRA